MPSAQHESAVAVAVRWLPWGATLVGLAGVALAATELTVAVSGLLMAVAITLELTGWRRRALSRPGLLGVAALCGALCTAAVVAGIELTEGAHHSASVARR